MIKNYKQYIKESLLDKLEGPSEEDIWNNLKDLSPYDLLNKSVSIGYVKGVKVALEKNALISNKETYDFIKSNDILTDEEIYDKLEKSAYIEKFVFLKSCEIGFLYGVKKELKKDDTKIDGEYNRCLPLIYAIQSQNIEVIKYLIDNGANVNCDNSDNVEKYYGNPLNYAVKTNNPNIIKLLIDGGADIYYKNFYILEYAKDRGCGLSYDFLLKYKKTLKDRINNFKGGFKRKFNDFKNNF